MSVSKMKQLILLSLVIVAGCKPATHQDNCVFERVFAHCITTTSSVTMYGQDRDTVNQCRYAAAAIAERAVENIPKSCQ